ncbi:META domain-containing protein [Nostoc sp. NIES-2111]
MKASMPPTMMFAKGKLSVFGGVNQITGSYGLVDNAVVMGDLASTKMAGPPDLMELESRFTKALAGVNGFTVEGQQLTLLIDGKALAEFKSTE